MVLSHFAENRERKLGDVQPSQPKRLLRRSRQCEEFSAFGGILLPTALGEEAPGVLRQAQARRDGEHSRTISLWEFHQPFF